MRIGIVATAVLLSAVPASAQAPPDVVGPRTLQPWMVACTDMPVTAKPEPRLTVKGIHNRDPRWLASRGSEVMIGRFPDDGLAPGQRYAVRRLQGDPKAFPRQGEGFGALRTAGWVTVTAVNEWNALAVVDIACDGINPGDYLDLYTEPALPATAGDMMPPDFSDRANVLPGTDSKGMFGDGDTLSINRGTAHGVVVGARYAFYRDRYDGKDGMPLFHLGDAVVVEPGELTSKVVVVKTVDGIMLTDIAVPRRPQR